MKHTRGTELKIEEFDNLKVVFGTIDKNNPKSLYIKISGWGIPIQYSEENNYKIIISKISKRIKRLLYTSLNSSFDKNIFIVDMNMRESGISKDKPSFMSCEITLYQKTNYSLKDEHISKLLNNIVSDIINDIFVDNEHFHFNKNKK